MNSKQPIFKVAGILLRLRPRFSAFVLFLLGIQVAVHADDVPPYVPSLPSDNGDSAPPALSVAVPADDPHLEYVGRFVIDHDGASCEWPASAVTIHFHGTAISAQVDLGLKNRLEVIVDGQPVKVLTADKPGVIAHLLASDLPEGDHTVTLYKCTESFNGKAKLLGFQLNDGASALPVTLAAHHVEVIGDSISCGYGVEGKNRSEHFSPKTENAYWTYGALTARAFGADYVCLAWSGRTLWPGYTLPSIYDKIFPTDDNSPTWNFDHWKADVVLINLSTNDFGAHIPDPEGWVKAYHDFLTEIRKNYPNATIYLAVGPMLADDPNHPEKKLLSDARADIQRVVQECTDAGDKNIHFLEFTTLNSTTDRGSDWHPSMIAHRAMADKFIKAIQNDLQWQIISSPSAPPNP